MKKYIKLIGVFLLIAGGVLLMLHLDAIKLSISGDRGEVEGGFITMEGDEIRAAWDAVHGWDESLYKKQYNRIEQRNKSGLYRTQKDHIDMLATLQVASTSSIYDAYMSDLLPQNYSHKALEGDYEGVEYLLKIPDYASNAKLVEVKEIHTLYREIYRFTRNSSHRLSVKLDTLASSVEWQSFEKCKEEVLSTADNYRKNENYDKLKSVNGFSEGLSSEKLEKILSAQNKSFYKDLSDAIIAHYNSKTFTEALLEQLNDAVNRYSDAYASDVSPSDESYGFKQLNDFYNNKKDPFDDPRLRRLVK